MKCRIDEDAKTEEIERVKFSGQEDNNSSMTWAGTGLLAVATADNSLRFD